MHAGRVVRAVTLVGLGAFGGPAPTVQAADPPPLSLVLVQEEQLPFTAEELRAATELRMAVDDASQPGAITAAIGPGDAGWIDVRVAQQQRLVNVAGQSTSDAARTVALVLFELSAHASLGLAVPAPPAMTDVTSRAAEAPAPPKDAAHGRPAWIALSPGVAWANEAGPSFMPAVETGLPLAPRWQLVASAGSFGNRVVAATRNLDARFVAVRAGISFRWFQRLELRAGAVARPYHLSGNLVEALGKDGWDAQAGAWLGVASRLGGWKSLAPYAYAHLDVFSQSVSYPLGDIELLRLRPWSLAAGLAIAFEMGGHG